MANPTEHMDRRVNTKLMSDQAVALKDALPPFGTSSLAEVGKPGVLTYRHELPSGVLHLAWDIFTEIILPVLIVGVGLFTSIMALWSSFGHGALRAGCIDQHCQYSYLCDAHVNATP